MRIVFSILQCVLLLLSVDTFTNIDADVDIRPDDGSGPAVTLDVQYTSACGVTAFSVDIVPAVIVSEWPHPAKHWTSHWLPKTTISRFKEFNYYDKVKPFVVPKIHPSGTRMYNIVWMGLKHNWHCSLYLTQGCRNGFNNLAFSFFLQKPKTSKVQLLDSIGLLQKFGSITLEIQILGSWSQQKLTVLYRFNSTVQSN